MLGDILEHACQLSHMGPPGSHPLLVEGWLPDTQAERKPQMETYRCLMEHSSSGRVWDGDCRGDVPGTWAASEECMIDRGGGSLLPPF